MELARPLLSFFCVELVPCRKELGEKLQILRQNAGVTPQALVALLQVVWLSCHIIARLISRYLRGADWLLQ